MAVSGQTNVRKLGALCHLCPYAKDGKPPHRPVLPAGPLQPKGILIGEGPGPSEVEDGIPFVGPTGRELDLALAEAGLARGSLYLINATACRRDDIPKTEGTMSKAVACCRPLFRHFLSKLPARTPAFAMGKWAWHALAGRVPKGGLDKGRGFLRKTKEGRPFIASWHPTFAFFYNPWEEAAFRIDLGRFARMLSGNLRARPTKLVISPTVKDLGQLVKDAKGVVSSDDESWPSRPDQPWTGKDPTRARLRVMGFGCEEWALAIRWDTASAQIKQAVKELWANPKVKKVTHNGPWFDHRLNARYGFAAINWEDTRDAAKALNTNTRLSLAYQASLRDDVPPWKQDEDDEDDKGMVFTDVWEDLLTYNCIDDVETARIWASIISEPEWQEPREWCLYALHKRLSVIAAKMHTRGVQVDFWNRGVLAVGLEEEFVRRKAKLIERVSIPAFRGTPDDLRALLFKRHEKEGLKMFSLPDPLDEDAYTEKGTIKCDQKSLLTYVTDPSAPKELKEILKLHWQAAGVQKARSTFVISDLIDQAIGDDGRLRASWNTATAATGRWGCSSPNLMNLSEKKED